MVKEIALVSNIASERFVHRPGKSYKGDEPFIFVSYRHNAWPSVYPVIKRLIDGDYRVWYDDGIDAGSEWPESIQEHLEKCNVFMPFITNDFCNSKNCRREVVFADESNKLIVPIFMEDTKLTQGMGITLASCQAIYKYQIANEELFYERLFEVLKDSYDVRDSIHPSKISKHSLSETNLPVVSYCTSQANLSKNEEQTDSNINKKLQIDSHEPQLNLKIETSADNEKRLTMITLVNILNQVIIKKQKIELSHAQNSEAISPEIEVGYIPNIQAQELHSFDIDKLWAQALEMVIGCLKSCKPPTFRRGYSALEVDARLKTLKIIFENLLKEDIKQLKKDDGEAYYNYRLFTRRSLKEAKEMLNTNFSTTENGYGKLTIDHYFDLFSAMIDYMTALSNYQSKKPTAHIELAESLAKLNLLANCINTYKQKS